LALKKNFTSTNNIGHQKRVSLGLKTINYVSEIWYKNFSDRKPDLYNNIIETIHDIKSEKIDYQKGIQIRNEYWSVFENLMMEPNFQTFEMQSSLAVIGAAIQVLTTVLSDENIDFDNPNFAKNDLDLDPYDHDAAYWAALAYAGPLWDINSSPIRRKKFWLWWLEEAVSSV